ncbi:MAG: hypothetical protein RLZZ32_694 [Cyanobacteriota bacterium]|jgi:hypothetical protein
MTKLVIYSDNSFELLPDDPPPRKVKPLELAGYFAAATAISGVGLLALPFVITALGAAAPLGAVGFFLHRLWKANR